MTNENEDEEFNLNAFVQAAAEAGVEVHVVQLGGPRIEDIMTDGAKTITLIQKWNWNEVDKLMIDVGGVNEPLTRVHQAFQALQDAIIVAQDLAVAELAAEVEAHANGE
jgi:non-homologous end joining protein Ku